MEAGDMKRESHKKKPPVSHDDWTPLPDEWVQGEDWGMWELINVLSTDTLKAARPILKTEIDKIDAILRHRGASS